MIRTLAVLFVLIGIPLCAEAQDIRRTQDLSDATVRARKLSLENLIDSVITYAPKSYTEPRIYAVMQRTLLYKPGDTLFRADIPAYLVKGTDFTYRLKRDTTEPASVDDRLPADAHQRIMGFTAFPELTNLLTFLERVASASVSQRGFYATSGWGDSLRYHVIVPTKFRRNLITKMLTAKMDEDTILFFVQYTIRRKGWVLEENIWKATTAPRELVQHFRKSKSYREADSLMEVARVREEAHQIFGIKKWTEGPDGRYFFSDYVFRDHLMYGSTNLSGKKDRMTDYTEGYETHYDMSRTRTDDTGLRLFSIQSFFNKNSKTEKANGTQVTDMY